MAKSFDEKYADALAELERVQKKVSNLKAEKEKKDAQKKLRPEDTDSGWSFFKALWGKPLFGGQRAVPPTNFCIEPK